MKNPKVIVVMPAYNAEKTFKKTLDDIPKEAVDEIILVDDLSKDNTVAVAEKIVRESDWLVLSNQGEEKTETGRKKAILTVYKHEKNKGYGGNQKTCYTFALERDADIIIMLHPDYQYDPKLIKHFVDFIAGGYFDVMLGSRIRSRAEALAGGMPPYKYYANRALTLFQNLVSGQNLSEWHTGMRAYRRKVLEEVDFHKFSDDFVFDAQMLFGIIEKKFLIGDIPVPCRYFKEASSINFKRSVVYGLSTVWESFKHLWRKNF